MMEARDMLKASEVTQISEELINFGSLIDEVAYGRKDVKEMGSGDECHGDRSMTSE